MIVKVLIKQISLICFRVYLEVYVIKNPTRFSRWSVRLDGVISYQFFGTKEYSFEEVKEYHVSTASDDTLKVVLEMNDGKKFALHGGFLEGVSYESDEIEEYYKDDYTKEYLLDLTKMMKQNNVPLDMPSSEEFDKSTDYEYWYDIALEIQQIYGRT